MGFDDYKTVESMTEKGPTHFRIERDLTVVSALLYSCIYLSNYIAHFLRAEMMMKYF